MKYLYQQLLAFWVVIITIVLIVGVSFTQLNRSSLEKSNYQQLLGYAEAIRRNTQNLSEYLPQLSQDQQFTYALQTTEQLLGNQAVNLFFVDKDQKVAYPNVTLTFNQMNITKTQWEALKNGEQQTYTSSENFLKQKETTSFVIVPYFLLSSKQEATSEFYGALVVSQPASNIDESLRPMTSNLLKSFLISSVIAVVISYFYAQFQVRRINRIRQATNQIAKGNFDVHIEVQDRDEFDDLAEDFNKMAVSLKESQEEIERQEERRRQFMADASHEMRTPLTTINGLLEGLSYHAIPEDQQDHAIHLMQTETSRLIRLVNENLDYEKIRTNQISMIIKKFNGTKALTEVLERLRGKADAAGDQLILETAEPVEVFADYDRFIQIMTNLVQNAIQFTENGTIYVKIEKGYLETIVTVADSGIGMSKEQVTNIWDRYYKADPSRKNTKGESGLGLAIVQQLVKLHKGKISVTSELGEGTTFTLTFPDVEL